MKNKKGFTLVELMIVIGIAAILAVISIPSVMKWYKKDQFIQQTREIIDMINDARTNAITEKKCSDGSSSKEWWFNFNKNSATLECKTIINRFIVKKLNFDDNIRINSNNFYYKNKNIISPEWQQFDINDILNTVYIFFVSGQDNSHFAIKSIPPPSNLEKYDIKKIQIPLEFPEDSTIKRTICFDRIAGFPTMSLTEECDD